MSPPPHRAGKPRQQKTQTHETTPGRHPGVQNVPSISIEPDTSLELTEEMMHGQNKVMTRDTPLAKASGSDRHEGEVSGYYGKLEHIPVVYISYTCKHFQLVLDHELYHNTQRHVLPTTYSHRESLKSLSP